MQSTFAQNSTLHGQFWQADSYLKSDSDNNEIMFRGVIHPFFFQTSNHIIQITYVIVPMC